LEARARLLVGNRGRMRRKRVRVLVEVPDFKSWLKVKGENAISVKLLYARHNEDDRVFWSAKKHFKDIKKAIKLGFLGKDQEEYGYVIAYDETSLVFLKYPNERLEELRGIPEVLELKYAL